MIPLLAWYEPFDRGIAALKLQKPDYDLALSSFDEAVRMAGDRVAVLAPRKEVLRRIRRIQVAFDHSLKDGAPGVDFDVEKNSAFLFESLHRLPPQARNLLLHLDDSPASPSKTPPLAYIESLRGNLRSHGRNLIDYLPVETISSIAHLLVGSSSSNPAIALSTVSRRWRSILIDDKLIWGQLRLQDHYQWKEELDFYTSRGDLWDLELSRSAFSHSAKLRKGHPIVRSIFRYLRGKGAMLDRLIIPSAFKTSLEDVWDVWATPATRLRTLSVAWTFDSPPQSFSLPPTLDHIFSLVTLHLAHFNPLGASQSFYPLLAYLPNLENLSLVECRSFTLAPPPNSQPSSAGAPQPHGQPVTIPNLRTLVMVGREYTSTEDPPSYDPGFVLPKLEELDLSSKDYTPFLFPPSLDSTGNAHHLKRLCLSRPADGFNLSSFIEDALPQLGSLTFLGLNKKTKTNLTPLLNALVRLSSSSSLPRLCPLLTNLEFLQSSVEGNDLVRLVASRETEGGGARIEKLDLGLEGFATVGEEDEAWLREHLGGVFVGLGDHEEMEESRDERLERGWQEEETAMGGGIGMW